MRATFPVYFCKACSKLAQSPLTPQLVYGKFKVKKYGELLFSPQFVVDSLEIIRYKLLRKLEIDIFCVVHC